MSAPKASFESVSDAVDLLGRSNATYEKIREIVGGGSKTTITKHLETLDAQRKIVEAMPQALISIFDESRNRCFEALSAHLRKEAEKEVRYLIEVCDLMAEELKEAKQMRADVEEALQKERDARVSADNEAAILRQNIQRFSDNLETAQGHLQRSRLELSIVTEQHKKALVEIDHLKSEREGDAAGVLHRLLLIEKRLPEMSSKAEE